MLVEMKPDRLEDLIAANALYRPGPMELIGTYCGRKHGKENVPQVNPIMDAFLAYEMLTFNTEDHQEAARAFVEKRKPKYQGR